MTERRIGIFGGTFDPVHHGHIEVARRVRSLLSLDRVEFVLSPRSPHKRGSPMADAWHRFAMLTLATDEHEGFFVSTVELELDQPTYTIDTIPRLRQLGGPDAALYFILGADSFEEIMTWREANRLLESCHFAVMTRPGHSLRTDHLPAAVRQRVIDWQEERRSIEETGGYHIYLCGGVSNPISSTWIRQAIRERRMVEDLNPAVRRHIEKYHLYQDADETRIDATSFTRCD